MKQIQAKPSTHPRLSASTVKQPTLKQATKSLAALGISLRKKNGEYRVNLAGGVEASAYYTDDLGDAIATGHRMKVQGATVHENPAKQRERLSDLVDGTPDEINASIEKMNRADEPQVGHLQLEGDLTARECATVLHGLRLIQCGGRIEGCAADQCEHFDDYPALTDEEIDRLAERITFGPLEAPCAGCGQTPQTCTCTSKTWTGQKATSDAADLSTILAALRTYQEAGYGDPAKRPERIHEIATNNDAVISLDDAAIDELCEALNSGDLELYSPIMQESLPAPESHEAAAKRLQQLNAAVEHLGQLASFLREAHEEDIQNDHLDDGPGCSYCDAINLADRLQREAIGLKPRNWQPWQLAEDETPQAGRWILVDVNDNNDEHPTNQTFPTQDLAQQIADHFNG